MGSNYLISAPLESGPAYTHLGNGVHNSTVMPVILKRSYNNHLPLWFYV